MFNRKTFILSIVLLLVLTVGYLIGGISLNNNEVLASTEADMGNTITVSGEGTIKVDPDIAFLNIGVETENKDSQKAQEENMNKMNKIIEELKKQGIDEKNIKTVTYDIITKRNYNKDDGTNEIYGYIVRNIVEVKINDIDKVGKIIDAVSNIGSNYIRNIRFGIEKEEDYYIDALQLAIKNAEEKAKAMGQTIGVEVNKPYKVIEDSRMNYSVRNYAMDTVMKVKENTPVSSGQLEINASVNIIYKY
ncbi:SIMPL domain-containing protein [Clostridiisalibacter paucivorans]|uniref:SIMPL domain-containing protein n=1 Tax=Clostridiisalibacter paucivorans TaxID=408753 RepID=UPI00047E7D41|nr:SIMPL domain-containing protein [Clostridiisalibacter paucivorans]